MENRNYKFRKATIADIPELKEMYKATLCTINKADYTPEEIEDWIGLHVEMTDNIWLI
ncbi:hypothetical protein [Bacteroides sp.]|uniref:hypothetical protein n=1 Tax=Bacteroides sp. TaxID=29523 RepID=UPI0025BDC34D|nr:hypothetical protein [Bacteroides sp.]